MSPTPETVSDLQEQRYAAAVQALNSFREALEHLARRVDEAVELLACGAADGAFEILKVQRDALLDSGYLREAPLAH